MGAVAAGLSSGTPADSAPKDEAKKNGLDLSRLDPQPSKYLHERFKSEMTLEELKHLTPKDLDLIYGKEEGSEALFDFLHGNGETVVEVKKEQEPELTGVVLEGLPIKPETRAELLKDVTELRIFRPRDLEKVLDGDSITAIRLYRRIHPTRSEMPQIQEDTNRPAPRQPETSWTEEMDRIAANVTKISLPDGWKVTLNLESGGIDVKGTLIQIYPWRQDCLWRLPQRLDIHPNKKPEVLKTIRFIKEKLAASKLARHTVVVHQVFPNREDQARLNKELDCRLKLSDMHALKFRPSKTPVPGETVDAYLFMAKEKLAMELGRMIGGEIKNRAVCLLVLFTLPDGLNDSRYPVPPLKRPQPPFSKENKRELANSLKRALLPFGFSVPFTPRNKGTNKNASGSEIKSSLSHSHRNGTQPNGDRNSTPKQNQARGGTSSASHNISRKRPPPLDNNTGRERKNPRIENVRNQPRTQKREESNEGWQRQQRSHPRNQERNVQSRRWDDRRGGSSHRRGGEIDRRRREDQHERRPAPPSRRRQDSYGPSRGRGFQEGRNSPRDRSHPPRNWDSRNRDSRNTWGSSRGSPKNRYPRRPRSRERDRFEQDRPRRQSSDFRRNSSHDRRPPSTGRFGSPAPRPSHRR